MQLNLSKGLTHIRGQVSPDSLTKSCSGEGCQVYLTDIPSQKVVINVEQEFKARKESGKRCDRLLFYENQNTFVAVPIELNGRGKGDEQDVPKQLKSSLEFAATLVSDLKDPVFLTYSMLCDSILKEKGEVRTHPPEIGNWKSAN